MRHKLSSKLQQICMNTNLVVAYAIESRIQIDAARTIKIPRGAVKHPYSPIKVSGCKSVFLQRIEWSDSEDLQPLNIFGPWNRQRTFALSHTESFTYSASMNYNPLRIACCTISAENVEKRRGWSQRCLEACLDKRLTRVFFATASDRSLVEAGAHDRHDLHRVALRDLHYSDVYIHIRATCFIYMMCHAGDTSAAAELRVPSAYNNCGIS